MPLFSTNSMYGDERRLTTVLEVEELEEVMEVKFTTCKLILDKSRKTDSSKLNCFPISLAY